jgi:lipopolysaccharide/colanic/teichoic acid biosynthesis glycosyltransferase
MAISVAEHRYEEGGHDVASLVLVESTKDGAPATAASAVSVAHRVSRAVKLGLDISIAFVLLVALAPVLLLVILLIELESPGSPFYRARRTGYQGGDLHVLKFRKMPLHTEGLPLTLAGDQRLTRIGAVMTRTRIDELPQLWNVLRGQMSLVGPRPEDPQFVAMHAHAYERILAVRPGITGWSQLAFADESNILDKSDPVAHYVDVFLPAKVRLDCTYAARPRVRSDLATMGWTALAMLMKIQVSVHRETGRMSRRRRAPGTSPAGVVATSPAGVVATDTV